MVIFDGLGDLRLAVHDKRAVGSYGFIYRRPVEDQQSGIFPGFDVQPLALAREQRQVPPPLPFRNRPGLLRRAEQTRRW